MSGPANPVLVEIARGGAVESRHRGSFAVVAAGGRMIHGGGAVEAPVYPRSAVKPIQALAFVETGAAEVYDLSASHIAIACGSHTGEPRHTDTVLEWLARIDCTPADLECGGHAPFDPDAAAALAGGNEKPAAIHNNCSGKHAGFLTLARHRNHETSGYIRIEHPVQQLVLGILEQMCGMELKAGSMARDGCGIPVFAIPLGNIALAMARLADPSDQPDARRSAVRLITAAMAETPFFVAGSRRFDTEIIEAFGGRVIVKSGAEGVCCAALPGDGLGVAVKIDDGAGRAAEISMAALLMRLTDPCPAEREALERWQRQDLYNHSGDVVGEARISAEAIWGLDVHRGRRSPRPTRLPE